MLTCFRVLEQCIDNRIRNGAIKRSKLEAGEAPITYEAFVEELDEGDSFTATLVEVLVKVRASSPAREVLAWTDQLGVMSSKGGLALPRYII